MGQQPSTPVDICNLALDSIGQRPISSILAPQTSDEDICARWYDEVRREALRDYIFNFARKPAQLVAVAAPVPDPQYAQTFQLPFDHVRLLTIGDRLLYGGNTPTEFYNIADGWLYCDNAVTPDVETTGLPIEYIYDHVLVPRWDPGFVKVCYLRLADALAPKYKLAGDVKDRLARKLEAAELKAAAISGQEKPVRRVQRSRVRDVRRSSGIFRDPTRI